MGLKKFSSALLFSFLAITATSCGGSKSSSGGSSAATPARQPEVSQQQEEVVQPTQGMYRAVLIPLNSHLPHEIVGTVTIKISGDDFEAQTVVRGSPAGTKHLQFINAGTVCPEAADDLNGDSFIDMIESQKKTGSILIPLDYKLASQFEGIDYGPIANAKGDYVYKRSAPLTYLENDLRAPDVASNDGIVKLHLGELLNLSGRVVTIHGAGKVLPASVGSLEDMKARESLPIACGRLVRLSEAEENLMEATMVAGTLMIRMCGSSGLGRVPKLYL